MDQAPILTVTVPATVTALTTKTAFKLLHGISANTDDAKIDAMIDRATAAIEAETNRVFRRQTYSEQFRSVSGAAKLMLRRFPVASITSVTEDGTVVSASDYEIDKETGFLTRLSSDCPVEWCAAKIVVVYVAGYLLPGQTGRDLPADLEEGCLEQVKSGWFSATRDPLVKAEDIPDLGRIDYWVGQVGESAALVPQCLERIEKYRDRML